MKRLGELAFQNVLQKVRLSRVYRRQWHVIGFFYCFMPRFMRLAIPAHFRAPPTSAQPICPLLEVHFYWKESFGARGLSVVRNSGATVHVPTAIPLDAQYIYCSRIADNPRYTVRCPLLGVSVNGGSTVPELIHSGCSGPSLFLSLLQECDHHCHESCSMCSLHVSQPT